MATFVVHAPLTQKEAQFAYDGIKKWFIANPDRDTCVTETFTARRKHIKADILKAAEKGVILKEKAVKKTAVKKTAKKASTKKRTASKKKSSSK